jgi:hypothetical protein
MLLCEKMINKAHRKAVAHVFFVLLWFIPMVPLHAQQLSGQAEISLLTCGPGRDLYAVFGHTAIRVNDPVTSINRVYNFGTFDFNTQGFYFKFLRGQLDYHLSVTTFQSFYNTYVFENRSIYEQKLLLPPDALDRIYQALEINLQPQNRNYRYDFFEDNCTTRVLDAIADAAEDAATDDFLLSPANITFREGLSHYIHYRPWLSLGINLLLGPYSDKKITTYESFFLPDNLMTGLITTGWADEPVLIFQGMIIPDKPATVISPMVFFWLLLVFFVVEIIWLKTKRTTSERIDNVIFALTGVLGLLFLFLRLFSEHASLQSNMNILWANPLNLVLLMMIVFNRRKVVNVYLLIYALMIFYLLVNWKGLPQYIPLEMMPVLALISFRMLQRVFQFVKKNNRTFEPLNLIA